MPVVGTGERDRGGGSGHGVCGRTLGSVGMSKAFCKPDAPKHGTVRTPLRIWQKSPLKNDNACVFATLIDFFDFGSVISLSYVL
jgi:hypothetical protein